MGGGVVLAFLLWRQPQHCYGLRFLLEKNNPSAHASLESLTVACLFPPSLKTLKSPKLRRQLVPGVTTNNIGPSLDSRPSGFRFPCSFIWGLSIPRNSREQNGLGGSWAGGDRNYGGGPSHWEFETSKIRIQEVEINRYGQWGQTREISGTKGRETKWRKPGHEKIRFQEQDRNPITRPEAEGLGSRRLAAKSLSADPRLLKFPE